MLEMGARRKSRRGRGGGYSDAAEGVRDGHCQGEQLKAAGLLAFPTPEEPEQQELEQQPPPRILPQLHHASTCATPACPTSKFQHQAVMPRVCRIPEASFQLPPPRFTSFLHGGGPLIPNSLLTQLCASYRLMHMCRRCPTKSSRRFRAGELNPWLEPSSHPPDNQSNPYFGPLHFHSPPKKFFLLSPLSHQPLSPSLSILYISPHTVTSMLGLSILNVRPFDQRPSTPAQQLFSPEDHS